MKSKNLWITHEVSKSIKVIEIQKEIDFEGMKFEVLEMEKIDDK